MTIAPRPPISGSGFSSRQEGQDTLASDTVLVDFDTGSFDNKVVTLTANATFTLSATVEGEKTLLVKSDDGTNYTLAWSNGNQLGAPPANVSSTDGILVSVYYDGTNFRFL